MSDEFFERRVGTVVAGKWTLEKLLGVGGMAAVYVGRHHIGRRDAIKILHPVAARSDEMRARFEQEARAVARLGHPGTPRIDDIDVAEDGSLFLVMELLEGESLADRLERGGATPPDALRWMAEVLAVLGAAHAIGIVHRDVKPDNVWLGADGGVKLLDFGVARMREPGSLKTATGVALGTLPFMAPEQVRGEQVDARADLFGVGATLVRAVARRKIHDVGSDAELVVAMGSRPAPPARELLPMAPDALWPLVDRALAFRREDRYADAATMLEDVRSVLAGGPAARALALPPARADGPPALTAKTDPASAAAVGAATAAPLPLASGRPAPRHGSRTAIVLGASIAAGVFLTAGLLWALRGDGAEPGDRATSAVDLGDPSGALAPGAPSALDPAAPGAPAQRAPSPGQAPAAQGTPSPGAPRPGSGQPATPPSPPPRSPPAPPPAQPGKGDPPPPPGGAPGQSPPGGKGGKGSGKGDRGGKGGGKGDKGGGKGGKGKGSDRD